MNTIRKVILLAGIILPLRISHAQTGAETQAQLQTLEEAEPTPAAAVPVSGQFYPASLANRGIFAPIFPPGMGMPAWNLGDGAWLVNDLEPVIPLRNRMRMMGLDGPPAPGGGGGGGDYTNLFYNTYSIDTNLLWLELTNVSSGVGYANLHHATNQVYAIWSTPDLTVPFADWQVETEVWPTNTASMPFTVLTQDRPDLFLRAQDWTGVTENGNITPDWWLWAYFGTVDLSDTNLSSFGDTLLYDYQHSIDPNVIQFSLQFTNTMVNTNTVYGSVAIQSGWPAYVAVLVNDTNQTHAVWQPFSSTNVMVVLSSNGLYNVQVGLRGLPSNARQSWVATQLTLNNLPPTFIITNPTSNTVSVPLVQLQGYVSAALSTLTYDVSNATGILTNQPGYWQPAFYDTNLLAFTTNAFQCYDIGLTNGLNTITLHATDVAGNMATTNVSGLAPIVWTGDV